MTFPHGSTVTPFSNINVPYGALRIPVPAKIPKQRYELCLPFFVTVLQHLPHIFVIEKRDTNILNQEINAASILGSKRTPYGVYGCSQGVKQLTLRQAVSACFLLCLLQDFTGQ